MYNFCEKLNYPWRKFLALVIQSYVFLLFTNSIFLFTIQLKIKSLSGCFHSIEWRVLKWWWMIEYKFHLKFNSQSTRSNHLLFALLIASWNENLAETQDKSEFLQREIDIIFHTMHQTLSKRLRQFKLFICCFIFYYATQQKKSCLTRSPVHTHCTSNWLSS